MLAAAEESIHSVTQSSSTQPEKVEVNEYGVSVTKNAGKIGSRIDKLVRIHVPISYESWDKVPQIYKDDVWTELLTFYELESYANDYFIKKMSESFRRHKSELRTNYYDKFDDDENRLKNCPPTICQEDWDEFLKNEAKSDASERTVLGKKNRPLYNYDHHSGCTSHAVIEHEMVNANPTKEITCHHVWKKAHTKKDGTISDNTSSYFDKIAKEKETFNDSDEGDLQFDEDIKSQVFGKDRRSRTRSIGTKFSRTQVKASATSRKKLKKAQGDSEELEARIKNMEDKLKTLVDLVIEYTGQGNRTPNVASNEGGSIYGRNLNYDIAAQPNQKCEILNYDLEVIAIAIVCRDSTSSIIHEKPVPSTHEKLVVHNILLPEEKTTKINHHFAMIFAEVGIGGYVCHPKNAIRYLETGLGFSSSILFSNLNLWVTRVHIYGLKNLKCVSYSAVMFRLMPTPQGSFYVQNDIFRLNYA